MLFDTHAHLTDEKFAEDLPDVLRRARETGVEKILTCACTPQEIADSVRLAESEIGVFFAAGIHPENLAGLDFDTTLLTVERAFSHRKCLAVGEIGLDYYWQENPPKEVQKKWFVRQVELAVSHNLPVVVHDREAHADTFDILKALKPRGVLHCYSGSKEMLRQYADLGFFFGFGGTLTFPKSEKAKECLCFCPKDRILVETDCPYLAPVPKRGQRNEPSFVSHTALAAASLLGMDYDAFCELTFANAERLFGRL